ncbi:gag-pol fusion protein [Sugiyamaella lignohabitans]|uniref:Gag-pol fusion protein n=1 Tax=Sugiyamaella lignohabitans TaxID=796027 RepID=A0A161HL01_9ASCO|nr:gag-pol fusion protein [Sugiyamaella lignohabitans]ANB12608.1 gag-pol fusion protein [Sugiyamaella lignohabitans]
MEDEPSVQNLQALIDEVKALRAIVNSRTQHQNVATPQNNKAPLTWEEVQQGIKARFYAYEQETVLNTYTTIRQTSTVEEYGRAFGRVVSQLRVEDVPSDTALRVRFISGLRAECGPMVRLMNPTTWEEAFDIAYRFSLEGSESSSLQGTTHYQAGPSAPFNYPGGMDHNGDLIMGNANRLRPLTEAEREALRKSDCCFRCRRQGHIARDCPKGKRAASLTRLKNDAITDSVKPLTRSLSTTVLPPQPPQESESLFTVPFKASERVEVKALLHTGCETNLVHPDVISQLARGTEVKVSSVKPRSIVPSINSATINFNITTFASLRIRRPGFEETIHAYIVPDLAHELVLGLPFIASHERDIQWAQRTFCGHYVPQDPLPRNCPLVSQSATLLTKPPVTPVTQLP